jgi:RNA polymerase-binding protein DksA
MRVGMIHVHEVVAGRARGTVTFERLLYIKHGNAESGGERYGCFAMVGGADGTYWWHPGFDIPSQGAYNQKSVGIENMPHRANTTPEKTAMKKAELQVYKEQLLALRARLRGDVTQLADAALKKSRSEANGDLSSMPIHMADIGSDNFEQEFTLSLMENEGGTLARIEAALERIEEGGYGQCEECGAKIPKARLNAIPFATLCVRCAQQQEQTL